MLALHLLHPVVTNSYIAASQTHYIQLFIFFVLFFKSRPPYQVDKKKRRVCQKREFAARLSSCEFSMKFQDPNFKHEIFVRIDMKHSHFSNYFIICLQSIFSIVEIIIELFVVAKINSSLFRQYSSIKVPPPPSLSFSNCGFS